MTPGGISSFLSDDIHTVWNDTASVSWSLHVYGRHIYLGGAEPGDTFEFTMPKELALHMANTIQRLASPAAKAFPKVT